jgi:hypothetical protein
LFSLFVLAHFAVAGPVALYGLASQLACVWPREMHGCWYGQTSTRMLGWTNQHQMLASHVQERNIQRYSNFYKTNWVKLTIKLNDGKLLVNILPALCTWPIVSLCVGHLTSDEGAGSGCQ